MSRLENKLLSKQIEVFLEWCRRSNLTGASYREFLAEFAGFTLKEDIMDVSDEDVELWIAHLLETQNAQYQRLNGKKAVEALIRFYKARGVNGRKKEARGRPMDISGREQATKYRNMGLTLRETAKLTGKNLSWIHRVTKGLIK